MSFFIIHIPTSKSMIIEILKDTFTRSYFHVSNTYLLHR